MLDSSTFTRSPHDIGPRVPLFSLSGSRPGPRLVITGPEDLLRKVAEMFWDRREPSTVHGTLVLRVAGQDTTLDLPDETLTLRRSAQGAEAEFERILRRMAERGMISMASNAAA